MALTNFPCLVRISIKSVQEDLISDYAAVSYQSCWVKLVSQLSHRL